ncbi:hypothetical protein HMPREF3120_05320 [Corynebacterium sp. HMSC11D10]|uniref:hypothetical protein n=1 Tax=Corynebacterium sp. HMSC11D10 TaxID=1581088 RepID=UPI0008A3E075|nr:hypothetical protein [Corynebacterium sp. HMSC11D10]OFU54842.1 hypothetical protein HMPREF3120_05320 [Corynebacterium sp. HMSC11D10]
MLAAYWRGEITLRKLRVLIEYLPEDSPARWQATDGRPFTIRDAMMWRALWAVASVAQGLAGKDNNAFENMPAYPWSKPLNQNTYGSFGDHTPEEVMDYLDSL